MMKGFRFFVALGALCLFGLSFGNGVVARVKDPSFISAIVASYPEILGADQAGNSPFVRFEIGSNSTDEIENAFETDSRIVWSEDEYSYSSPENQSSHGSSVAAIYDRKASFSQNTGIWQQINFTLTPIRTKSSLVRIGIVDTGVSPLQLSIRSHVDAAASFVPNFPTIDDMPTGIDTNNNGVLDEGAGHGTMVAGVILQLCPEARLVVAKSADSDGIATSWSVLKGVVFCIENRAKVINLSLGSSKPLTGFDDFLDWVEASGVLIVSPIGNDNADAALFPAAYSNVVCGAGLLPDNTKAPFSNFNSAARICAPATGIQSAWYDGKTAIWSGTSFVAPLITGCLAAALPNSPPTSIEVLRSALKNTGKNIDSLNPTYQGKLGNLLDFGALLNFLRKNNSP